ncbi:MAG: nucleotidyltransferase domain-containing protein [Pseudomonadota bacterium]
MADHDEHPMRSVPPDLLERARTRWNQVLSRYDVAAAYLYGSACRAQRARDLDVGLVLRSQRALRLSERAVLTRELEDALGTDLPVDLRELTADDVAFTFAVLRGGVRVFEADREARIEFEARVLSDYQDLAASIQRVSGMLRTAPT